MSNTKISAMSLVSYKPALLIPAVDTTIASPGIQNVSLLASSLLPIASTSVLGGVKLDGTTIVISGEVISAVASTPVTSLTQLTDVGDLTGLSGQFVGFNSSNAPAAFSKATAQANLSIAKATLTFFMNSVLNGTYTLIQQLPASFTINSVDTSAQFGSFVVSSLKINSTGITGLSSLTVNSTVNTNTLATAANVGAAGDTITLVISGVNQAIGGVISLNLTRN